jgi:hypothetical protein
VIPEKIKNRVRDVTVAAASFTVESDAAMGKKIILPQTSGVEIKHRSTRFDGCVDHSRSF